MTRYAADGNICSRQNELEILQYASFGSVDIPIRSSFEESDLWVTSKFSLHTNKPNYLFLGSNCGILGVFDVNQTYNGLGMGFNGLKQDFIAHRGVIMDISSVPGKENEILTVGGDSAIRLWDLNTISGHVRSPKAALFHGHADTIRSVCFVPDSSNEFVTGGRDGTIKLWDRRVAQHKDKRSGLNYYPPKTTIPDAHLIREMPNLRSNTKAKKAAQTSGAKVSIVSLLFLDENMVASAASNAASGIRIWDIRKLSSSGTSSTVQTLEIPTKKRSVGVTSLALDRFGSSLFASVTHNDIHEYAVNSLMSKPVRSFTGNYTKDFDVTICTSPDTDYLLSGSSGRDAFIWSTRDAASSSGSPNKPKQPAYLLGGHNAAALSTSWSADGNYIATMDAEGRLRVWAPNFQRDENEELITKLESSSYFRRVERVPEDAYGSSTIETRSPKKAVTFSASRISPRKGRKRLHSTSSPTKRVISPSKTPTKSPVSKMMKLSTPVLPLGNKTNTISLNCSPRSTRRARRSMGMRFNPFYAKYPTEALPNKVYERHIEALRPGTFTTPSSSPAVARRLAMGEWLSSAGGSSSHKGKSFRNRIPSVSEFGESICSKMISAEERLLHTSPKKLVIKKTPVKSALVDLPQSTDIMSAGFTTPSKRRSSRKNLLDYFSKSTEGTRPRRL